MRHGIVPFWGLLPNKLQMSDEEAHDVADIKECLLVTFPCMQRKLRHHSGTLAIPTPVAPSCQRGCMVQSKAITLCVGDLGCEAAPLQDVKLPEPVHAGELDFQADEAFLEAMVTFALSVPLADIWQDRAWARQQQRLLTAQFGPDEVAWVWNRCLRL